MSPATPQVIDEATATPDEAGSSSTTPIQLVATEAHTPIQPRVSHSKKQRTSLKESSKSRFSSDGQACSAVSSEMQKFKLTSKLDLERAENEHGEFDVLKFYSAKQEEMPAHVVAVRRTYSHVVSEAESEREFNHSKQFLADNRTSTKPKHVEEAMFVGRNWRFEFLRPTWQEVLAQYKLMYHIGAQEEGHNDVGDLEV